jgi:hypothetical protein
VRRSAPARFGICSACCACLAGCGLNVQSPDLFLLTRTAQGKTLTMLVNDGGTISCDGAKAKQLADTLLIQARDLASDLDRDAKAKLQIPRAPNSVALYTIKLQNGTISFPDTAADKRHELAEAELFALQAGQQACGAT